RIAGSSPDASSGRAATRPRRRSISRVPRAGLSLHDEAPLMIGPRLRVRQDLADRCDDFGPLHRIVVIAGEPAAALDLRQPRVNVGGQMFAIVPRVEVYPGRGAVGEEARRGD